MPTMSPLPWNSTIADDGYAYVKDANGNIIAAFKDPRDADHILEQRQQIDELEQRIADIEEKY